VSPTGLRFDFGRQLKGIDPASSAGALAELFDISCMDGTAEFSTIQCDAFNLWNGLSDGNTFDGTLVQAIQNQFNVTVTGQHYFQPGNNGTLEPIWDLRSVGQFEGNPGALFGGHKLFSIPSPNNSAVDVAWLELGNDFGSLANKVYRINTVSGQPPQTVSSSVDRCISCSINVILFIV
jgi:hypothetical protein